MIQLILYNEMNKSNLTENSEVSGESGSRPLSQIDLNDSSLVNQIVSSIDVKSDYEEPQVSNPLNWEEFDISSDIDEAESSRPLQQPPQKEDISTNEFLRKNKIQITRLA